MVSLVCYVYLFYPLVLSVKRERERLDDENNSPFLPFVSILIPAHNEEKHIAKKIQNALDQDYPNDRLEILIASDGSTDRTVPIAKSFNDPRIKVIEPEQRQGKNAVLNEVAPFARGEILVFTDANALFNDKAIKKLVAHFNDEKVGLVCGHLKYLKDLGGNVGKGEGLYFRYESLIKRLESRWGAVPVVTGSIYAIRKGLFVPLDLDVANDFAHPVQVGAKGYKVVFEPEAVAYERTTASISEEFKRRTRIVTRGFTAFGRYWKRYHMLRGVRGFCFVSHKLLRWFVPFFLIALFVTNLCLEDAIFRFTLWAQIAFYGAAFCGIFIRGKWGKPFVVPFYFCMINLAALVGFVNYLRGRRQAVWDVATTTR